MTKPRAAVNLTPFWPYLVFGQWTHLGKGATFGLGGYRLERYPLLEIVSPEEV